MLTMPAALKLEENNEDVHNFMFRNGLHFSRVPSEICGLEETVGWHLALREGTWVEDTVGLTGSRN